jgi:high-affinity Fe2+/Pb2+ permease
MAKSERVPRFSPLGELLLGVGVLIAGPIVFAIGRVLPTSFIQSMLVLLGGIALVVGVVLVITGTVRVVRAHNARQELVERTLRRLNEQDAPGANSVESGPGA